MSKQTMFYNSHKYRWKEYKADPLIRNDVNTYVLHIYESGTGDIYQVSYKPARSRATVALMSYENGCIIEFCANGWDDAEYLVELLSTYDNREVMPLFQLPKPEKVHE